MKTNAASILQSAQKYAQPLLKKYQNRLDNLDLRYVQTFFDELYSDTNKALSVFSENFSQDQFLSFSKTLITDKSIVWAKQQNRNSQARFEKEASKDSRYLLLLDLINEAEQKTSLSAVFHSFFPIIGFPNHSDKSFARKMFSFHLEPANVLLEINNSTGEAKKTALLLAIPSVIDLYYMPYLAMLFHLNRLREGKLPGKPPRLGSIVPTLHKMLEDYPGLVNPLVPLIRNAAAHPRENTHYKTKRNILFLRNENKPWQEFSPDELEKILIDDIYQISGPTIRSVINLYLVRKSEKFFHSILDALPAFLKNDHNELARAEKEFNARKKEIFDL
ncbi:MAG: hypothetical protein GY847_42040 [Proteobacteria bacterium]|nr:hypothetical protein [Pseudomonadota bacterium]